MVFVISGHQSHNLGKYIILKNRKYVIFHFFGQQLMKNASSPKIASDAFLAFTSKKDPGQYDLKKKP